MKNRTKRISSKKALPPGSIRTTHPVTGVRCWFINGKYYRSRADFTNPTIGEDGKPVDKSM